MKRNRLIIVCISLLLTVIVGIIVYYNMSIIYHSKEHIHNRLVKDTPLGSNKSQVLKYVKEKGYTIESEVSDVFKERMEPHRKIGSNYISVYLGEYQGIPWKCDVTVFWVFNENEKLIYIDVWKDYDAP